LWCPRWPPRACHTASDASGLTAEESPLVVAPSRKGFSHAYTPLIRGRRTSRTRRPLLHRRLERREVDLLQRALDTTTSTAGDNGGFPGDGCD
jgi:hypothetical protein